MTLISGFNCFFSYKVTFYTQPGDGQHEEQYNSQYIAVKFHNVVKQMIPKSNQSYEKNIF